MFYEDLSKYSYDKDILKGKATTPGRAGTLNVGWLDAKHDFAKGDVPERFVERLLHVCCFKKVNPLRRIDCSPFRPDLKQGYFVMCEGRECVLGIGEIRVAGKQGVEYAAPDLVYHFVKDLGYQPPQEFIDAVLAGSDD